jgi:hypothetical protein
MHQYRSNPADHVLTFEADGNWHCSCGEWNSRILGSVHSTYCKDNEITEAVVRKWHTTHANALVIQLD